MKPDFRAWRSYAVTNPTKEQFTITVRGRDLWALKELVASGPKGCTPIDNPAPRWSGYIHRLRELGVEIETVTETHGGPFAGWHGRYVLRSKVEPVNPSEGAT